ncbi:MAG: LytR C-terminal domain-containing protein [Thermoleophilia bacterium]|nr:LytR C-terminal domain-containing protein [Thermoleophilia bacterium]
MVASPLGAARVRRRLTVEEAAARAELDPEAVRSLEESRVYRFESAEAALAATLVYATALGISRREARQLAGLPVPPRLVEAASPGRLLAGLAFLAACAAVAWWLVLPGLHDRPADAPALAVRPTASPSASLPQPWEIQVDVYDGTGKRNAATLVANEVAALAYRIGAVERATNIDYRETRVYFPPGGRAIAERLAAKLGVGTTALPGGDDPLRLVVIVGTDRLP